MTRAYHLAALRRLMPRVFARYGISSQWRDVLDGLRGADRSAALRLGQIGRPEDAHQSSCPPREARG